MKKALSIFLALIMIFGIAAVGITETTFLRAEATETASEKVSATENNFVYEVVDGNAFITDYTDKESTDEIIIPDILGGCTVTGIGAEAFCGCMCTAITIPATVTYIAENAFAFDMPNIERYTVNEPNYNYSSYDGVLYESIELGGIVVFAYPKNSPDLTYTFEKGTIAVGEFAFCEVRNLKEVSFDSYVAAFLDYAFYNCADLESIEFQFQTMYVGDKAFAGCTSLNEVQLSSSIDYFGCDVFEDTPFINDPGRYDEDGVLYHNRYLLATKPGYDKNYYEIKEGTYGIAGGAFDWDSLEEVVIPKSIQQMEVNPFFNCSNLETFTLASGSYMSVDEYGVLLDNTETVSSYPNGRYQTCYAVSSDSDNIARYAFYNSSVKNFYIPVGTEFNFDPRALGGDTVTDIHYKGDEASWNSCLPVDGWYDTRPSAFDSAEVHFNSYSTAMHYIGTQTDYETVCSCGYTADLVPADGEFYENGFSYNVIDGKAAIMAYHYTDETDVIIPETLGGYPVASIAPKAFLNCECKTLYIPSTLEKFEFAFNNVFNHLEKITVSDDNPYFSSDNKGILYNKDKTKLILCPRKSPLTVITIASTVKEIGAYAFSANSNIKTVTIPSNVETIRFGAFDSSNITKVTINEGLKHLGDCVFHSCLSLSSVTLPESLEYIGWDAFVYTPFIKNAEAYDEDGVFYYGDYLLASFPDSEKTYYEIKEGTRLVAGAALIRWNSLEEVVIPKSAEFVNGCAFSACENLQKITAASGSENFSTVDGVLYSKDKTVLICYPAGKDNICYSVPQGVTKINEWAFLYAVNLRNVNVPVTVTEIGACVFDTIGSSNIQYIRYEGTKAQWEEINIADDPDTHSTLLCVAKYGKKVYNSYSDENHDLESHVMTAPTCVYTGKEVYTCSCGYQYIVTLPALGHTPDEEYTVITEADCTTREELKLYCSVCDKCLETKFNPELGHEKVFVEYLEPTCELVGGTLYKCERCEKEIFEEDQPELGHIVSETKIMKEATCTTNGGLYYACERCFEPVELIESYEATGHTDGEWKRYKEATCSQQQIDILYCATCKKEVDRVYGDFGEHSYAGEIVDQNCEETMMLYTCTGCGDSYTELVESDGGHITEAVTVDPTCTEAGRSYKRCTVCGETVGYITVLDPLGHTFEESITKDATCSEEGLKAKTCIVCDEVEEEVIPKISHTFGSWEYAGGNTFSGKCSVCGDSFDSIEVDISLDTTEIKIYNRTSKKITASVTENITDEIEYVSSDDTVAVVDSNGKVTGRGPGNAVITARIKDTDISAECNVTILARSFGIEWISDGETIDYYFVEEGSTIEAPEAPEKAGYVFVGWSPEIPDVMPAQSLAFTAVYNIVSQSAEYDVSATYSVDAFSEPVSLDVKEVEGEREPGGVYMVDGQSYNQVGLYNIKAVNEDSEVVQPNEGHKVTIKLALPAAYANRTEFVVYHRFVDGTREQLSTAKGTLKVENGYLIFEVSSFSEFEVLAVTSSIEITKLPDKTTYFYKSGKIDLTGIVVTFKNSNGTTKTIDDPSMLTVTGFNSAKIGKQTVTVHYGQYSDTMQVTVTYAWWQFIINMLTFGLFLR